ncbi:MAG: SagB/ThcOx family dehydrogenase [Methanobrevibacter sp.]|jgi:SagB-type dehydrogenase family enzyme|nr:SagB/ThcOx family dehydrogenase [Candidatus Methanovirga aequatorialis]
MLSRDMEKYDEEKNEKYLLSKLLEERLLTIYDSYHDSPISSPIEVIQNRLVEEFDEIGLRYLLNYQNQVRDIGNLINLSIYGELYPYINQVEIFKENKNGIQLDYSDDYSEISKVLSKRKSIRDFSGKSISFNIISNILFNASNMWKRDEFLRKNTSSGGGLYSIDIYLYANTIDDLNRGIYKFNPFYKNLELISNTSYSKINEIFGDNAVIDFENSGGIFLFTFDYLKVFQKYGELSLSLGFIEIGLLSQNIHILSVLYGLGTCDVGGFDKNICEDVLKIDGINTHAVYAIVFGDPKHV